MSKFGYICLQFNETETPQFLLRLTKNFSSYNSLQLALIVSMYNYEMIKSI